MANILHIGRAFGFGATPTIEDAATAMGGDASASNTGELVWQVGAGHGCKDGYHAAQVWNSDYTVTGWTCVKDGTVAALAPGYTRVYNDGTQVTNTTSAPVDAPLVHDAGSPPVVITNLPVSTGPAYDPPAIQAAAQAIANAPSPPATVAPPVAPAGMAAGAANPGSSSTPVAPPGAGFDVSGASLPTGQTPTVAAGGLSLATVLALGGAAAVAFMVFGGKKGRR